MLAVLTETGVWSAAAWREPYLLVICGLDVDACFIQYVPFLLFDQRCAIKQGSKRICLRFIRQHSSCSIVLPPSSLKITHFYLVLCCLITPKRSFIHANKQVHRIWNSIKRHCLKLVTSRQREESTMERNVWSS